MKKFITKLLFAIALLTITIPVFSANTFNRNIPDLYINNHILITEDFLQDEKFIKEMENSLEEKYGENYEEFLIRNAQSVANADKIKSLFPINQSGETIYPNFIGGLYINDENDLVVQIVNTNVSNLKTTEYSLYMNVLDNEDAIIESVNYSYAELNAVNNIIVDYYLKNNTKSNITAFYIDVINNRIVVELKIYTKEEIDKFKNTIVNSPFIIFKEGKKAIVYANLKPGGPWSTPSGGSCSFGYRAMLGVGGRYGIVSAGHCASNGQIISGVGTVAKWKNSGNVDALWIETTATSNTPTNNLYITNPPSSTTISTTVLTSFTVGQTLGKIGYASGFTNGKVTNANYSSGGLIQQVNTDFWAQPGDSGGIVFKYPISDLNGGYSTAGLVRGGSSPNGGNFFFTRADKTNSAFGLSRY